MLSVESYVFQLSEGAKCEDGFELTVGLLLMYRIRGVLAAKTYMKNGVQHIVKQPKMIPRTLTPRRSLAAEMVFDLC